MVVLPSKAWLLGLSVATLLTPLGVGADSDLALTCGPDFAVFDRGVGTDRRLLVVPWSEGGGLRVSGSVAIESDQPRRWLIHGSYVVVRSWNDLHVFRVGADFVPTKVWSAQIDQSRGNAGGTVHIEVDGSGVWSGTCGRSRPGGMRQDLMYRPARCVFRGAARSGPAPDVPD